MKLSFTRSAFAVALLAALSGPLAIFGQGSLTPPGAPAPTMKTLQQVEPRTPISSLPITITNGGSYYLATNLTGAGVNHGITINANGVTIDLMGFELIGAIGSLNGIHVLGLHTNITIRNGTVRNWAGDGVNAGFAVNSQLRDLSASRNSGDGIFAGAGSLIIGCNARQNGGEGIFTDFGCRVSNCAASNNGRAGIRVTSGTIGGCAAFNNSGNGIDANGDSVINECIAQSNGTNGIRTGFRCTVANSSAAENADDGIETDSGCNLIGCTAADNGAIGINSSTACTVNGCTAYSNTGTGIDVAAGSAVLQCTAYGNTNGIVATSGTRISGCNVRGNLEHGITVSSLCQVENNHCSSSTAAQIRVLLSGNRIDGNHCVAGQRGFLIVGTDNLIVRNSAQGASVANYDIVAGNHDAARVASPGAAFASTSPWVNFSF